MTDSQDGAKDAANSVERELVISRLFAAPRELVFKAWTDPAHFARWWGPAGFTIPFRTIDLRPGGVIHFCIRSSAGQDIWCKGVYQQVVAPSLLVSTSYFSDAEGNMVDPARYGMRRDFPSETLITVTFEDREGKTLLTFRQSIPVSLAERVGAVRGWHETFDRLAAHLASE